jgi:hypothetical protein
MSTIGPAYPDSGFPGAGTAIDVSSSDFNCATAFTLGCARWITPGTSGNITAQKVGDAVPVLYTGMLAGVRYPGQWILIKSAGTTCTGIVCEV